MKDKTEMVDFGGVPVPKVAIDRIKAGLGAKRTLADLQAQEERARKSKMELGGVTGSGLTAQAPSIFKALQVIGTNVMAEQKAQQARDQMQGLGTQVDDAALAQMELERTKAPGSAIGAFQKLPDGTIYDSRTGEVVREGTPKTYENEYGNRLKFEKELAAIKAANKKDDLTSGERKVGGYLSRMQNAEQTLGAIGANNPEFNPASRWESMRGVTNTTMSSEMQQYRQAANDWIRAKLRKESGAVIGEEEMQSEYENYFPQPGDSAEVIAQKAVARRNAMAAMGQEAGIAAAAPTQDKRARLEELRRRKAGMQ